MDTSRSHRHYSRELPRFWIALPVAVRRRALDDPLLAGLFPSHVGFFPNARGHAITRHQGLTSTIVNYCVKGRGWCRIANVRHEVVAGDLIVVPAGEPHAYGANTDEPWTLHWFHAMGTNVGRLTERLGASTSAPVVHLGRSAELEALFTEVREALEDELSDERLLDASLTLAHLVGVLIRLRRLEPRAKPHAVDRMLATLEYVKAHLSAPHGVSALASLADLSPSRYSTLVRRSTGKAPGEYVAHLRMRRAAELLGTTKLAVKEVAREVGFADALHFSRVFRRAHRRSPRRYRAFCARKAGH